MNYLAISKNELMRFSHHWLWGLRVDITVSDNFLSAVERLKDNKIALQHIEDQVLRISQRPWHIRALHWFFNWGEYRLHYYQLQACLSWQLYEKGSCMMFSSKSLSGILPAAFLVGAPILGMVCQPLLRHSMQWFSQRMQGFFSNLDELNELEEGADNLVPVNPAGLTAIVSSGLRRRSVASTYHADETLNFIVSSEMLMPLRTLGLIKNIGDIVVFAELKKAYIKRSRETHPDKTFDATDADFIEVTAAYKALISIVEQKISVGETELSLIAKMNELRREMQQECQIWKSIAETARHQNEQLKQQVEVLSRIARDYDELNRRARALDERLGLPPISRSSGPEVGPSNIVTSASNPHRLFLASNLSDRRVDDSGIHSNPSDTLH